MLPGNDSDPPCQASFSLPDHRGEGDSQGTFKGVVIVRAKGTYTDTIKLIIYVIQAFWALLFVLQYR